ncbi:MAG TPA: glycosyltransferase [Pyrinomonadaceae bacterium]|nr:glycosyltransferase [Pyrinomonadaceae bacterium]HMP65102.1 glycosyltransferase [Pyrinomonadaceae bacterium]
MNAPGTPSIKTLHLTNYYHRHSGGISTSFNNLMDAAERRERHVRLIVPGERDAVDDVNPFAKIYFIKARPSPFFDKRYRILLPWQYMPSGSLIREIMLAEMPDIVEVTDKYTLSMIGAMVRLNKFSQLGRPILVHFSCERMDDNVGSFISRGKAGKWLSSRVVGNYLLPSFDYHIANSSYTADEFYESVRSTARKGPRSLFSRSWRIFGAPRVPLSERVFVCPRGVNTQHYRPDRRSEPVRRRILEAAGFPDTSVVLLYAGRLSPEKNVGLLIGIIRELANGSDHDFRLIIAGDGPERERLENEGKKLGDNRFFFAGHLDSEALAEHYANVDVFIHPNPKEPFGIAPLEAMASGVPTVAPRSGGILSYASDDNAWLVDGTVDGFVESIRAILHDESETQRRTENALKTAIDNSREAATDRLFDTYDRIYKDFYARKEMFAGVEKAKRFDYTEVINV